MRIFATTLLAFMVCCSPAHAGGHAGYGLYEDDEAITSFTAPISGQATVEDGLYTVNPIGTDPLTVELILRDTHFADVVFTNRLAPAWMTHEGVDFVLEDGRVVTVFFDMRQGDEPDTITVLPPPGYVAIPPEISVEEDAVGVIEIHEQVMG